MSEYASVSRMLADDGMRTLPIACRLVPLDQWLVTHVDTSWKVKDIKHWILSKCNAWGSSVAPQPPRFRPASPVTFSAPSRRSSYDSASHGGTEEGDDDEWDLFAAIDSKKELHASDSGLAVEGSKSPLGRITTQEYSTASVGASSSSSTPSFHPQRTSSGSDPVTSTRFTLLSFASGFILEEDAELSWYKPRPFELFELHRAGAIVSLPRSGTAYVEPYFESPVQVSDRPHIKRSRARAARNADEQTPSQTHAVEWKPRWAIICNGMLNLCKEATSAPSHTFPIASLCVLGGPEQLGLVVKSSSRIICAKFRRATVPEGAESDEPQAPWHPQDRRKPKPSKTSSWVVLDMPSRSSYESLLRVMHRLAPTTITSSFLPNAMLPRTPVPSPVIPMPTSPTSPRQMARSSLASPSFPSFASSGPIFIPFGVLYPEWRLAILSRARQAGVGELGPAMTHYLFSVRATNDGDPEGAHFYHHLPRAPSISEGLRRQASHATTSSADGAASTSSSSAYPWSDAASEMDDEDDIESEVEWDGWVRDIARRAERPPLPKLSTGTTPRGTGLSRSGIISPSSPSSSSEYDHSEGGGSTRSRALSYAPHPTSYLSGSPISGANMGRSRSSTISAATVGGAAFGATYMSTTTITTYVDRVPDAHPHQNWQQRQRPTSPAPVNTPRVQRVRNGSPVTRVVSPTPTVSTSASMSELSGMEGASEASNSVPPPPSHRAIGGVKRIVRGVSIRNAFSTDRLVRGLEDALDFVDGK
ncbi:hypothetical protein DFH11DRAFT_1604752 [Phellopilus nigrolimitatus]|nr:hypothetical protein DFH11DRAFT_1604752 [Phellopilus nigrolimitatus]